jgi:class 3 adenylate cyclase
VWRERRKSERLLLNILPASIARRLKQREKHIADHFEEASVVFIDIAEFTIFSRENEPERVVEMLNNIYTAFDKIAAKHNLEKIKTIGDCYMAAAGVPLPRADHAASAARFALEAMALFSNGEAFKDGHAKDVSAAGTGAATVMQFRCGIDCGPVVAGVIGEKKFIYDLWGDTVNTAYRMEEYGENGRIHVTGRFRTCIEGQGGLPDTAFVERGIVDIKGKGRMSTWYMSEKNN